MSRNSHPHLPNIPLIAISILRSQTSQRTYQDIVSMLYQPSVIKDNDQIIRECLKHISPSNLLPQKKKTFRSPFLEHYRPNSVIRTNVE